MKKLLKPLMMAGLVLTASAPIAAVPAAAQQAQGVGVVNLNAIIARSNALQTAEQQRQTTYAAQIQQATQRQQQLAAQLQPLYTQFQTAQQSNAGQQALQQQAAQIQQIEAAGQRELQTILQPVALSRAYVQEQIEEQLDRAIQQAATKKRIDLVIEAGQGGVLYAAAPLNITQDVLTELNTLLPSAQLVPPQGWLPREIREQQAAAAAQQAQPAAAPATQQPTGR